MQKINGNSLFLPPQRHTFAHRKKKNCPAFCPLPPRSRPKSILCHRMFHYGKSCLPVSGTAAFSFSCILFFKKSLRIFHWSRQKYPPRKTYVYWSPRHCPHFSVLRILTPYCKDNTRYFWLPSYCPDVHRKQPDSVFAQFSVSSSYFRL